MEDKKNRPYKLALDAPLPEETKILPTVEKLQDRLHGCDIAYQQLQTECNQEIKEIQRDTEGGCTVAREMDVAKNNSPSHEYCSSLYDGGCVYLEGNDGTAQCGFDLDSPKPISELEACPEEVAEFGRAEKEKTEGTH